MVTSVRASLDDDDDQMRSVKEDREDQKSRELVYIVIGSVRRDIL